MIWVSWRRQRLQLITLRGVLLVGGGAIALLRSLMVDDIAFLQITQCVTERIPECSGTDPVSEFKTEWITPLNLKLIEILRHIPPDSGSRVIQPLLYICASTGLRYDGGGGGGGGSVSQGMGYNNVQHMQIGRAHV